MQATCKGKARTALLTGRSEAQDRFLGGERSGAQRLGNGLCWGQVESLRPRHKKTGITEERVLGVWLHLQRIDYRAVRLAAARKLNWTPLSPAGVRAGHAAVGHDQDQSTTPPLEPSPGRKRLVLKFRRPRFSRGLLTSSRSIWGVTLTLSTPG